MMDDQPDFLEHEPPKPKKPAFAGGWVAMPRQLFEDPLFAPQVFTEREAFLWLICAARWEAKPAWVNRQKFDLQRGELAFASRFLAKRWRWSDSRVRRFLKRLVDDALITTRTTRYATRISICNYDQFCRPRRADDAQSDAPLDLVAAHPRRKEEQGNNRTRNKASRLPEGWQPTKEMVAYAEERGFQTDAIGRIAEDFRDYWVSAPNGRKLDWLATWRAWCRREMDRPSRKRDVPEALDLSSDASRRAALADPTTAAVARATARFAEKRAAERQNRERSEAVLLLEGPAPVADDEPGA